MAPNLAITSFEATYERLNFKKEDEKYIKIMLTDSPKILDYPPVIWFLDLDIKNNFDVNFDYIEKIDYDEFVYNHKLFVNEETRLLKLKIVEIYEETTAKIDMVVYRVIVMTDNTALYEMELVFTISATDLLDPLELDFTKSEIINVYNNYGISEPYPHIEVYNNAVALNYYNYLTKDVTLVLYELKSVNQNRNRKADDSQVPLHTLQGGHKFTSAMIMIGTSFPPLTYVLT